MDNGGQLNNNSNEQDNDGFTMDEIPDLPWNSHMEYDVDAFLGAEDHVNTNQTTDDVDHRSPVGETPSKGVKRFAMHQIQELEAQFRVCSHPNPDVRQELATKIGLEERQVKFWFQNRRSQMKVKAYGDDNKGIRQELAKLKAENEELKQRRQNPICFMCTNPIAAIQSENWRLLNDNTRLKDEYVRSKAHMDRLIREAAAEHPPSAMRSSDHHLASAHMNMDPVALTGNCRTTTNLEATLTSHAARAMKEFVMLATKGEPMWVLAKDGEKLNHQEYILQTFPGLLGLCPQGFVEEATRETDMIKGTAMDLVSILTDVMNVELWVQSPRLLNRSVKFLRFSKMMANGRWAVVDVSVDGIYGVEQEGSSTSYTTGCRLLPSGCLLEDMSGGYCKVTWVVHAEYDETTVPFLFRPLLQSGQALGACRWLRSLQKQCEYITVLPSSHVLPSSSSSSAISTLGVGRRSVMELAGQMMVSFYAAVSGPVIVPATSSVNEWRLVSNGNGTERVEAFVRLVTWNCADIMPGEPSVTVLSATTTVWLPGTPPLCVFEYLCDLQRRGEWDTHVDAGEVKELSSVATSPQLPGNNVVSVLEPTTVVTDETESSKVLILQETSTDVSCFLVVYSLIEESLMRGIMDGRERSNIFVLPSGFAILPDGHGKAHADHTAANSSNSAPIDSRNNNAGSIVSVAFQTLLPGNLSSNLDNTGAFEDARLQVCHAITKIKAAVGASNIIPA
ncbi:hypothetical protein SORBI_3006G034900 [Sorghum bicolor]|nr:hypothetical protein SORBI_3006G034900 [Sorghum bicolor]OQU81268.1 hypothetical protein SORBI_3006G034900 [Sorghum bicolor]